MSEPTEADRQKATTLYESMRGHTKMMNIESVWDAIAEACAEGRAAGRREMREEAARVAETQAKCSDNRADAETISYLIRRLPDHPETKDKGQ